MATLTNTQLKAQRLLIERAKHDPEAFGELFDAHYDPILNYLVRRTGDVAIAEDLTSTTFMKALDGIQGFTWRGVPFSAWLYRIAGNELRMYYRGRNSMLSLDELQENDFQLIDEYDLESELVEAQTMLERQLDYRLARQAIAQLPVKYQEVLTLRFGERQKISQIATILHKKEGTVKSLLSRALARLKKELAQTNGMQPFAAEPIMNSEGRHSVPKPQEQYER